MEGVFSVTGDSGRVESIATCTAEETEEKCCYHLIVVPAFAFTRLTGTKNGRAPFPPDKSLGIVRVEHLKIKRDTYQGVGHRYFNLLVKKHRLLGGYSAPFREDTVSCSALRSVYLSKLKLLRMYIALPYAERG